MDKRSFLKKQDLIIILSVLFLCAAAMLFARCSDNKEKLAEISVDGQTVKIIKLSGAPDSEFRIDGLDNVVFSVKDEKICILESDCHDKICCKTGYIGGSTRSIICLPKKVMVKIVDEGAEADIIVG